MSREVGIMALNPVCLSVDGESVFPSRIIYTRDWIERLVDQNQEAIPEGRLIIACSYESHRWILKAVEEAQEEATNYLHTAGRKQVFVTAQGDIFGRPEILLEVVLKYWQEWHSEDPRWAWSQETIKEFFHLYQWAIIYIDVY